jgi:hypothetical protein
MFMIPVTTMTGSSVTLSPAAGGNCMAIPGLGATGSVKAAQLCIVNGTSTGGGTAYFTDNNAAHTIVKKFTIPTYAIATISSSVTPTTFAGGSATTLGAVGAAATGDVSPSAAGSLTGQFIADSSGNLYITNAGNNTISKIDTGGNISQFVGGAVAPNSAGSAGSADTGATSGNSQYPGGGATFKNPQGICIAPDSLTMFVADTGNYNIRIIT